MRDRIHQKTNPAMVMKKIICLLMIAIFIVSLSGSTFMMAYEDDPGYDGEIIYLYDLPILCISEWDDDFDPAYQSIMPLSSISVGLAELVSGPTFNTANNSFTISLRGSVSNPANEEIIMRGFWIRTDGLDDRRVITGTGGNVFNSSSQVGGLRPNTTYLVRAVVQTPGMVNSAIQGGLLTITTPSAPSATPTPPPGNTPTPPPSGATPTPPPSGPTPTPAPATPYLNFAPSTSPWNSAGHTWSISGGQHLSITTITTNQGGWFYERCNNSGWLTISGGTGLSGESFNITAPQNDSGNIRTATITVRTVAGSLYRTLTITQAIPPVTLRPTGVIESFERNGHVNGSRTPTTIRYDQRIVAEFPIWNFVHIAGTANTFAIRNNTTGLYFTETIGGLSQQESITGPGLSRQRWTIIPHSSGAYAIRSVSNNNMYVTGIAQNSLGTNLALANRDSSNNRQLWWIGYIWHIDRSYIGTPRDWVGFWDRTVNIQIRPQALEPNASAEFYAAVDIARDFWARELGLAIGTTEVVADANIRIYWASPADFGRRINNLFLRDTAYGLAVAPALPANDTRTVRGRARHGTIQAGGSARTVYRLYGTGDVSMRVGIWPGSTRNVTLLPFTATHELGHALGYWGHAPNSRDLMSEHPGINPEISLRPAEREHILQIYRRFR
ncbi:MAG: hypothetical protein FWE42_07840 [Defluviitaleaceae bacterium]|nr:hypothetical protein [Defluviitaleaceae bacterium]